MSPLMEVAAAPTSSPFDLESTVRGYPRKARSTAPASRSITVK